MIWFSFCTFYSSSPAPAHALPAYPHCCFYFVIYIYLFTLRCFFYSRHSHLVERSCQRRYQKVTHNDGLSMRRKVSTHLGGTLRGGEGLPFGEFHASLNHGPNVLCIIFIANNFFMACFTYRLFADIYNLRFSPPFGPLSPLLSPLYRYQLRYESSWHSIAFHLAKCIVKNVLCIKCNRKI